jgi:hypothetical protein
MTHIPHTGSRCRTIHPLRTVKGDLPRGSPGTILRAVENLGRVLVVVHWNHGFVVPAFPHEIEFSTQDEVRH